MSRTAWGRCTVILLMIAGLVGGIVPNASAYQVVNDPNEALVEGDVKNVFYWDEGDIDPGAAVVPGVIYGFQSWDATTVPADAKATWSFDLNAAPNTAGAPDGIPGELCIKVKFVGGNFQAELYKDCGAEVGNSYPVTQPATDKIQFAIPKSELVAAGLSGTATSYNFRVSNTNALNETDQVPDNTTAVVLHTFGEAPPPPPPPPGAQQAFDYQDVSACVPQSGILSIDALQPGVGLGSVPAGSSKTTGVGDILYTNTLASGLNWNVTVEGTSLKAGANVIHFSNLAFKGGATITPEPAAPGAVPTAVTNELAFGASGDADANPGVTYGTTPVTIATATPDMQCAFRQTGSTLKLSAPSAAVPGSYVGKLRYTITG